MSLTLFWFILFLVVLGLEMMTGTIYLLAIAVGFLCGAIVGFFDVSFTISLTIVAIVTIVGVILAFVHRKKLKTINNNEIESNNLDKGQLIQVTNVDTDGSARVRYRGTMWTAVAYKETLQIGVYTIHHIENNKLFLIKQEQ